jgi:hypothetical protein
MNLCSRRMGRATPRGSKSASMRRSQSESNVTAKVAAVASIERSPLQVNLIFSVLIKAILDPAM